MLGGATQARSPHTLSAASNAAATYSVDNFQAGFLRDSADGTKDPDMEDKTCQFFANRGLYSERTGHYRLKNAEGRETEDAAFGDCLVLLNGRGGIFDTKAYGGAYSPTLLDRKKMENYLSESRIKVLAEKLGLAQVPDIQFCCFVANRFKKTIDHKLKRIDSPVPVSAITCRALLYCLNHDFNFERFIALMRTGGLINVADIVESD